MEGEPEFEPQPEPHRAADRARSVARGTAKATVASARATRAVGRGTGRFANRAFRLARRASHAEGAGDSGLARMIELHAFNAAGDAAVAISLAGTLFFQVPGGDDQARGKVALFLLLTMLPFAIVAPLIGPFLDRFSHGRRWAIGTTMAIRGFLCWVLAGAIADESLTLFPAALGVLVASKAYGVTKAAAVPRLAPPDLSLVKANSRISLAGITGAAISAPIAVLASMIGPDWSLRYAFVVFAGATILAILLPEKVDNAEHEQVRLADRRNPVPHAVVIGLRANSGLRMLSGFLTLFMAFLLRTKPFEGWEDKPELLLALVIGAAGLGNTLGIGLGNVLKRVKPSLSVLIAIFAATTVAVITAVHYTLLTAVLLGLTAGLAQSFGKLSLDAMIQAEIPEANRSSAFARSEMLLQLSWVMGAFVGIALPLEAQLGLGVIGVILLGMSAWVVAGLRQHAAAPAAAQPTEVSSEL
ncbi:MAG TPA: MFS transporter [Nocardioidaceae bacterium]|nr:MFS transporter [Nocardioidaceae bacterium]